MREQVVIQLPQRISDLISQSIVKSILIKQEHRDITIKIIEGDTIDIIEIETG